MTKTEHEKIKDYYTSTRISQSKLKKLLHRPMEFLLPPPPPTEEMVLGTAADLLITRPMDRHLLKVVSDIPPDSVRKVFDIMVKRGVITPTFEDIITACNSAHFQESYKNETRHRNISKHIDYYNHITDSDNIIITEDIYSRATRIAASISELPQLQERQHIHFQQPLYFSYEGVACKALPDAIHYKDGHLNIIDIKTTSTALHMFHTAVDKYRYDIQAAFYMEAAQHYYSGIKSATFTFIVQHTTDIYMPLVVVCSDAFLQRGKYGSKKAKGFHQLIHDYLWYREHGFNNHKDVSTEVLVLDVTDYGYPYMHSSKPPTPAMELPI